MSVKNSNNTPTGRRGWIGWALAVWWLAPGGAGAESFPMPYDGGDLIGEIRYTRAHQQDTLLDIAREYSVGQDEMVVANPQVDRWLPGEGTQVLLPRRFILPDAPRAGIVVNIPEMRLYYYPVQYATKTIKPKKAPPPPKGKAAKGKPPVEQKPVPAQTQVDYSHPVTRASEVITYPVSIGRMDWKTPIGATRIIRKDENPVWIPPESIKKEHAKDGDILPDVVPAGPDNPLGLFALRLGVLGYLIHGTDRAKSYGIGMRATHGCIRMYPEDIEHLFPQVSVGTPVYLVNQPVKLGWSGETLYAEVTQPLDEYAMTPGQLFNAAMEVVRKKMAERPFTLDAEALRRATNEPNSLPVAIGRAAAAMPIEAMPGQVQPYPAAPGQPVPVQPYPAAPGQPAVQRPYHQVQQPVPAPRETYAPPGPAPAPRETYAPPAPQPSPAEPEWVRDQSAPIYDYPQGQYSPKQATPAEPVPPPRAPADPYAPDREVPDPYAPDRSESPY
jgi:L,D-transpeptidase ErfK/SrfK